MREKRRAYKIFVVETEGRRPRGRPRLKREANVDMDLREI
jgi:hypothetical protein